MDQGGFSALLFDLLNEDLHSFDPRKMPLNDFGFDLKMHTAGSAEKFLFAALQKGQFHPTSGKWGPFPCEKLYDSYRAWCQREGLKQVVSSEFGKCLKKLLAVEKSRSMSEVREWWYMFPPLKVPQEVSGFY